MKNAFLLSLLFVAFSNSGIAQALSVEKIWKNYEFRGEGIEGFRSMQDGLHFTRLNDKNGEQSISKHEITNSNGAGTVLISAEKLAYQGDKITIDDYFFNEDETKVLLTTQTTSIYRRSYTAVHFLFDLKTGTLTALDEKHQPQTLAEHSPDGTMVSYIYKNDLYVKDIASGKVKKLTQDGKRNKVINGTTDWVYEEEFSITKAYDWSPDSKYIGFLRFNEKEVKEFNLTYYGELYPQNYSYKYPKAGEDNSKVTAHIVTVKSGKISPIDLGEYEYIPRIEWSGNSNKLILQTLNRHQNDLKYHLIDLKGKKNFTKGIFSRKIRQLCRNRQ
jgi:dipeptidyl-peptidase-4